MAAQTRPLNRSRIRRVRRLFRAITGWTLLIAGLYFFACLAGSMIGTNTDWREPDTGILIYVETNGIHTAIIMPRRAAGFDWSAFLPASDLADPRAAGDYLSFSWGHRRFYLETESWGDLKLGTVGSVFAGSTETLMHVYHQAEPQESDYVRSVRITEEQYLRLVDLIEKRFKFDPDGTRPSPVAGYGHNDVFYEATGRYTLINTCNTWTGRTLRQIGVQVGAWTPMAGGVMRWFPEQKTR